MEIFERFNNFISSGVKKSNIIDKGGPEYASDKESRKQSTGFVMMPYQ